MRRFHVIETLRRHKLWQLVSRHYRYLALSFYRRAESELSIYSHGCSN